MFARTERLLLRPAWAEDAPALHAAIAEEAIVANLARAPWPYRLSDAEAFVAHPAAPRWPQLLAFARGAGPPRLVGGVGLHSEDGEAALGYWLARAEHGRGYATEAAAAVIAMARSLGHRRIVAGHFVDNPASGRVLARLGFRATGRVAARASIARARLVPTLLHALELDPPVEDAQPIAA